MAANQWPRDFPPAPRWYVPEWLEFLGVPQAQLCEATGLSEAYVAALVSGTEPYTRDILWMFSCVLNVPPGVLIDIDPRKGRRWL